MVEIAIAMGCMVVLSKGDHGDQDLLQGQMEGILRRMASCPESRDQSVLSQEGSMVSWIYHVPKKADKIAL